MRPLLRRGWERFGATAVTLGWAAAAAAAGRTALRDPANDHWWRHGRTWFAGVDVLGNRADGAIGASGPLEGPAVAALSELGLTPDGWHAGQLSVVRPGYPAPDAGESLAAARFRRDRDAAHLDGLLPVGPERRRHLQEPHAFVLGLPLTDHDPGASPLVVWEGSHRVMRDTFARAFDGIAPRDWQAVDVTDAYQAARRQVFGTCKRVVLHARPGEAYLVHRLALHGVAPWADGAGAPDAGRMIAYFRPLLPEPGMWLSMP